MFKKGEKYLRRKLHDKYGGQRQGGISTPGDNSTLIFLFTAERGEEHGYKDGWVDNNTFLYSGEGQQGDMAFVRGNKAIRDHMENGKDLHLFSQVSKRYVEYVGKMVYKGHQIVDGSDTIGQMRKMIVFELQPIE